MFDAVRFGRRLRNARKKTGYTQEHAGRMLCVTRQQISNYENGKCDPSVRMLYEMAELYRVSIDWLCATKGDV